MAELWDEARWLQSPAAMSSSSSGHCACRSSRLRRQSGFSGWLLSAVAAAGPLVAAAQSGAPPPRPIFLYATELTAESFIELVEQVANNTVHEEAPLYLPLVMFHVTWCTHCMHSLPEFEEAAKIADKAKESGQLSNIQIPPKFFVIECDTGPATQKLCEKHTGTSFPAIKLFRDHRAIRFNRPRKAQVFAWWAMHAARPMITMLERSKHVQQVSEHAPAFFLKADFQVHAAIIEAWGQVAFDYLEGYNFYVVQPQTEAGKFVQGTAPVAVIRGSGLDPFPFKGAGPDWQREEMLAWANFNRFPAVTDAAEGSVSDLLGCGMPVVTYAHSGVKDSAFGLSRFTEAAKELRKSSKYLFATMNMSVPETSRFVRQTYKLMTEFGGDYPRIFVFNGVHTYWEDPTFVDSKSMTSERLDSLLANEDAKHDGTWRSGLRERRKLVARLATTSFLGAVIVIAVPSLGASCCWLCFRELWRGDELQEDASVIKKED